MDGGIICGGLENPQTCIKFDFKAGCWYPYSSKLNWQRAEHVKEVAFEIVFAVFLFFQTRVRLWPCH